MGKRFLLLLSLLTVSGCVVMRGPEELLELSGVAVGSALKQLMDDFKLAESKGQSTERIEASLESLSNKFPSSRQVLWANCVAFYLARKQEKALVYADLLLRDFPLDVEAVILRSRLALGEGNSYFARELLTQKMLLIPNSSLLREAYAAVLFAEGNYDSALESLNHAQQLGGDVPRVTFNLGLVSELKGDFASACEYYRRAAKEPDYKVDAEARLAGISLQTNNCLPVS